MCSLSSAAEVETDWRAGLSVGGRGGHRAGERHDRIGRGSHQGRLQCLRQRSGEPRHGLT